VVDSPEELIDAVNLMLAQEDYFKQLIRTQQQKVLLNPGSSVDYFKQCVRAILNKESLDGWWHLRQHQSTTTQ